jgi:hypothetical protein
MDWPISEEERPFGHILVGRRRQVNEAQNARAGQVLIDVIRLMS